jgi:hypothetical protein
MQVRPLEHLRRMILKNWFDLLASGVDASLAECLDVAIEMAEGPIQVEEQKQL